MAEQRLLSIDVEPETNGSAPPEGKAEIRLWTRSDNTFQFDFLPDNALEVPEPERPPESSQPAQGRTSFAGAESSFAFNFQIPVVSPVKYTEMAESTDARCTEEKEAESCLKLGPNSTPALSVKTKTKKKKNNKKKSVKSKVSDGAESQQSPAEEVHGVEDSAPQTQQSKEEQLNRQLDWCIEQLELGMGSQKATAKQKQEASSALKTLRSSKAPLVKKRQVMRAMNGEYRKKMEEEKNKQFKLIESEMASAQVRVVSDPKKSSVYCQRTKAKTLIPATEDHLQQVKGRQAEIPPFTFTPSKEEFCFNFF